MAKERLKQAVEKAAQEASAGRGWGTVSADMRKKIMDMIRPKVNWRSILRNFVKKSQRADKRSTVKRYNKKYRAQKTEYLVLNHGASISFRFSNSLRKVPNLKNMDVECTLGRMSHVIWCPGWISWAIAAI